MKRVEVALKLIPLVNNLNFQTNRHIHKKEFLLKNKKNNFKGVLKFLILCCQNLIMIGVIKRMRHKYAK